MSRGRKWAGVGIVAVPSLLFCIAVGYVAAAQDFSTASRAIPQLVGIATALLCVLDGLSRTGTPAGRAVSRWLNPAGGGEIAVAHKHRQAVALAGIVLLAAAMVLVGLLPSIAVFGFLALRLRAGRGWLTSAGTAAGLVGFIWALFHALLGLQPFPGLLFGGQW
jgi:hypothetical protein